MNDSPPLLTVAIPAYNASKTITTAIHSIQQQIWDGNLEIFIYNDGSTDETKQVVEALINQDARIILINGEKNYGRAHARNMLLEHARGQFLAWLDADDEWLPAKLDTQIKELEIARKTLGHTNIFCVCPCFLKHSGTTYIPLVEGDQLKNILQGTLRAYLPTTIGYTQAMRSAGEFDTALSRLEDTDFFINFVKKGGVIITSPGNQYLYLYNRNDNGKDARKVYYSIRHILNKHRDSFLRYGKIFYKQSELEYFRLALRFARANKHFLLSLFLRIRILMRKLTL